jgi:hypothetical protein
MRWLNRDPIREYGGMNLYSQSFNNTTTYVDYLGWDVIVIKHLPGEAPPGGWPDGTNGMCMALTVYNGPIYEVSEVKCQNGRSKFKVDVTPPNSFVDVYFRTSKSFMFLMCLENDHVSVARRHEKAVQDFKRNVELVCDYPDAARAEKNRQEQLLIQKTQRLRKENEAYDAPGGKHVLQERRHPKKK